MTVKEAIEVLKTYMEVRRNAFPQNAPDVIREAIDTVVDELEQVLPKDYKCPCCGSDKVYLTAAAHCGLCATTSEI